MLCCVDCLLRGVSANVSSSQRGVAWWRWQAGLLITAGLGARSDYNNVITPLVTLLLLLGLCCLYCSWSLLLFILSQLFPFFIYFVYFYARFLNFVVFLFHLSFFPYIFVS